MLICDIHHTIEDNIDKEVCKACEDILIKNSSNTD